MHNIAHIQSLSVLPPVPLPDLRADGSNYLLPQGPREVIFVWMGFKGLFSVCILCQMRKPPTPHPPPHF